MQMLIVLLNQRDGIALFLEFRLFQQEENKSQSIRLSHRPALTYLVPFHIRFQPSHFHFLGL